MKTVAEVIGVSRSNLVERLQQRPPRRIGRPPLPDQELVAQIKATISIYDHLSGGRQLCYLPSEPCDDGHSVHN